MDYKKYPGQEIKEYGKVLNNSKPVISIVTPYYNSGKTIEETYNSVMSQTYPFFEWIIVDDGSKDKESLNKLSEIEKKDSRINVYHKENGGPSQARDYGIEKISKSVKYVFFLDSDDTIVSTMLECLYWSLETHPDASFAYTTLVNFGTEEYLWEKYLTIEKQKEENLINISSMVRIEDLLEVGCFGIKEKAMYEDWNLWLKLIRAGKKPLRISAPLFWYRRFGESELSRAHKNKENAMRYVSETASTIPNDIVEPIQYPRYGEKYATCKEYDMILPDYEKDKRKTILFLIPWMVVGGADLFNLELLKRLPKNKYRLIALSAIPSDNPLRQSFEEYAEVYDMSTFLDKIDYLTFTDYIISSRKVDLVFVTNSFLGYYMVPVLKSKYPDLPFIDYIHAVDTEDPRLGFGRTSKDVDCYLSGTYCCNNLTTNQLINDFNKKNVKTIYIGTDSDKFDPKKYNSNKIKEELEIPKDKKVISFIARLSEEKRPETFVEIAKRIHEKDPDTYFVIAGDGPLMNNLKEIVDSNFKLLGMVKETQKVYAISDATILCSTREGLALTSYESLSMSVPVISADVGGQTELIDSTVGGVVHYNKDASKKELDDEINNYVEETLRVLNNIDEIKKNCRKKILDGFTLDLMAEKMDKVFEKTIQEKETRKYIHQNETVYELACELYNDLYSGYTNMYYLNNMEIDITRPINGKSKYQSIRNALARIGAVKEGKIIFGFLESCKNLVKDLIKVIIEFVRALISFFKIIFKLIKKIIMKIFK